MRAAAVSVFPYMLKKIFDTSSVQNDTSLLFHPITLLMACLMLTELSMRGCILLTALIFPKLRMNVHQHVIKKILFYPALYFRSKLSGTILHKVTLLPKFIEKVLEVFFQNFLYSFLSLVATSTLMFFVKPIFSYILIVGLAMHIAITLRYIEKIKNSSKKSAEYSSILSGQVGDMLANVEFIVSNSMEDKELKRIEKYIILDKKAYFKSLWEMERNNILRAFFNILTILIFTILLFYLFTHKQISLGDFTLISVSTFNILNQIWILNHQIIKLFLSIGEAETAIEILDTPQSSRPYFSPLAALEKPSLEIKNLYFSYPQRPAILKDINFSVNPGEKVLLLGDTGSGKSTLFYLIMGMLEKSRGDILINDKPLNHTSLSLLRSNIGFIGQFPHFFNRTIKENIFYGVQKGSLKDSDISKIIEDFKCNEILNNFSSTLFCQAGEKGGKLSGGQKQKLNLARVTMQNRPLLLLDEINSSLGKSDNHIIRHALKTYWKNKTVIISGHNIFFLDLIDRVIILQEGKIIFNNVLSQLSSELKTKFGV